MIPLRWLVWPPIFLLASFLADDAGQFDRLTDEWTRQFDAGRFAEAEKTARTQCEMAAGPLRAEPVRLAGALLRRARAVQELRRYAESAGLYNRAIEIWRSLPAKEIGYFWCWNNLGMLYKEQGKLKEAEPCFRQALQIGENLLGREHLSLAVCLNNMGRSCQQAEQSAEAEKCYQRALVIREKQLPKDHPDIVQTENNLADLYRVTYRFAEAEALAKRALAADERARGPDHLDTAWSVNNLGLIYDDQGRDAEAEKCFRRALAIREKALPAEHPDLLWSLNNLGLFYNRVGRAAEAEKLHQRVLSAREKALGPDHPDVAASLANLAVSKFRQMKFADAVPLYKRALAINEKCYGPDSPTAAVNLSDLCSTYQSQGRYDDAEPLAKRVLAIYEKQHGPDHPDVAGALSLLAGISQRRCAFDEAERYYKRVLAIREKALPADHPDLVESITDLAEFYFDLSLFADAEPLFKRAVQLDEHARGLSNPTVGRGLMGLGAVYAQQGRYAEAETTLKRAIAVFEKTLGQDHPIVELAVGILAVVYDAEGRGAEAEPLLRRTLAVSQKNLPPGHPLIASCLYGLGLFKSNQGQYADAAALLERATAIDQAAGGPQHPDFARDLDAQALNLFRIGTLATEAGQRQQKFDQAESLYRRSLAIREKVYGPDHPTAISTLSGLAELVHAQHRDAEAKQLLDRVIAVGQRAGITPGDRVRSYFLRAKIHWKADRRAEALADLHRAMELAEQQRAGAAGGAAERARLFANATAIFERMVAWQIELGDMQEALAAMERARARALLDQFATRGIDLLSGVPEDVARALRQREHKAQMDIARLEKLLGQLDARTDLAPQDRQAERSKLEAELRAARQAYVLVYADIRSASPAYQLAVGRDQQPVGLERLGRWLAENDTLLLEYMLGEEGGYLLAIPAGGKPRLLRLSLDEAAGRVLGVSPGPLTADRLRSALSNPQRSGVMQLLGSAKDPSAALRATPQLAALWQILVPEAERAMIVGKKIKRLAIIPDAALSWLPFETLVVRQGPEPEYLLDRGIPIEYAPSATVLLELAARSQERAEMLPDSVLAVGDPLYPSKPAAAEESALGQLAAASRYGGPAGTLAPLPYTAWEVQWVAEAFDRNGMHTSTLQRAQATEANVRRNIVGRRIIHLACHGLADQAYGNFFGALALTPGPPGSPPSNDGFLTLAEIYELDLKGCELAILSACQTNFGPEQRGEGVVALSRGFLVAGARRVLASNWLVDDEAAASLVSSYCDRLGAMRSMVTAGKQAAPTDYADALTQAKQWIRRQDKWKSPFYWGTFVLLGPH